MVPTPPSVPSSQLSMEGGSVSDGHGQGNGACCHLSSQARAPVSPWQSEAAKILLPHPQVCVAKDEFQVSMPGSQGLLSPTKQRAETLLSTD